MWLQHILVLLIVAACFAVVVRQAVRALVGKKSKLGACCAKGCGAGGAAGGAGDGAGGAAKPQAAGGRVVFFPSHMLAASRRASAKR